MILTLSFLLQSACTIDFPNRNPESFPDNPLADIDGDGFGRPADADGDGEEDDINGDGIKELAIGAERAPNGGYRRGGAYVFSPCSF